MEKLSVWTKDVLCTLVVVPRLFLYLFIPFISSLPLQKALAYENESSLSILTLTPGVIDSNQTICYGLTPSPIVNRISPGGSGSLSYFWQKSTISSTVAYTNITSVNTISYTPGSLTQSTWFRRGVTNGVDTTFTDPIKISVVRTPHSSITGNQTICSGTVPDAIFGPNEIGVTYLWISSTTSASQGYTVASGTNNTANYTPDSLLQNTWYRRINLVATCPSDTSSSIKIGIQPAAIGGNLKGGTSVCITKNNTSLTLTGTTGVIANWQWSNTPDFTTFVNIPYKKTTYTEIDLTSSRYYRAVTIHPECTNYLPVYSTIDSIIVNTPAIGGTLTGGTTICAGPNSIPLNLSSSSGNILRWESSSNRSFTSGVTPIPNTSNSYIAPNLNQTTYYRIAIQNSGCPLVYSTTDSFVVKKTIGGTLSVTDGNCPVCPGSNSKTLVITDYNGDIKKWQSSPKYDFSANVTDIANTTSTYTISNLSNSTYYRAYVQLSNCYGLNSSTQRVNVNAQVTPGKVVGGSKYCIGPNKTRLTLIGIVGGVVNWESSTDRNFLTNIITIANTTTQLKVENQSVTTYYRALIANSASCPGLYSTIDSIVILPQSAGGFVSANNKSVCELFNSTILSLVNYTGSIQWQQSISSSNSEFTNISGATNPTYTANNIISKTYYRAIVTNNLCAPDTSVVDSVMTTPRSLGGIVSGNQEIVCKGSGGAVLTLTRHNGTVQWQSSTTSAITGFNNINGEQDTFVRIDSLSAKTYFRAISTNGTCPSAISSIDSVEIIQPSSGGTVLCNNDSVCIGSNTSTLTLSRSIGNIQWQSSTISADSGFNNINNAVDSVFYVNNLNSKTYFRAITTNGLCPSAISTVDSIIINQPSQVGMVTANADTVCSGSNSIALKLSESIGNIQWQSSTTSANSGFSNITGANDSLHQINNLIGNTYFRVVATNGVCPPAISLADSVYTNRISKGGVVAGNNDTVCINSNTSFISISKSTGHIQWQSSTTSAASGFSNIVGYNDTFYVADNLTLKTYFRAVVTNDHCPASISTVDSILIAQLPIAGFVSGEDDSICIQSNKTRLTLSGSSGNIQWQQSTLAAGMAFSDITNANDSIYYPNNLSLKTYFRAIVTSSICPLTVSSVDSVIIRPSSIGGIVSGDQDSVCSTSNSTRFILSQQQGSIQWQQSNTSSIVGFNNVNENHDTITVINLNKKTYFRAIVTNGICPGDTSSVDSVFVNSPISFNSTSGTSSSCSGTVADGLTGSQPLGETGQYSYLWLSSIINEDSGFVPAQGFNTEQHYSPKILTQNTWYKRIVYSGSCAPDTSTITTRTVKKNISYKLPIDSIVAFHGSPLNLPPAIPLKYSDSSSFSNPVRWDTSSYMGLLGVYSFIGEIILDTNTCNTENIQGQLDITVQPRKVNLEVFKFVNKQEAFPTDTLLYSIIVKLAPLTTLNPQDSVFILDILPDSLIDIKYSVVYPFESEYKLTSGALILNDSLTSKDSIVINITGKIHPNYQDSFITNKVQIHLPYGILDYNNNDNYAQATTHILHSSSSDDIITNDQFVCKGTKTSIQLKTNRISNPIFTWYLDSSLTTPFLQANILDTLLLTSTTFFVTVKGDHMVESKIGKRIIINILDHTSDTLSFTKDTSICYKGLNTVTAIPINQLTNPTFTWYTSPELNVPIGNNYTLTTESLKTDTTFYVVIKGSTLCESIEIHRIHFVINKSCGNVSVGLAKALTNTVQNNDGSFELSFSFVTENFGNEPINNIMMTDDLTPVFPTAKITILQTLTLGSWKLNPAYNGVDQIELLDSGNQFGLAERQIITMRINVKFPEGDTSTTFHNVAEIRGTSSISGKMIARKSLNGLEPKPDTLLLDSINQPTPIILSIHKNKKTHELSSLFIPEGFSPNGDQVNDLFVIDNPEQFTIYLGVYNRWGNLVYETNDYHNNWDGKKMNTNESVPDGTYFYVVEYMDDTNHRQKFAHSLTIIR